MAQEPTASELATMTPEERDEFASKLVDRLSLWSGAAGLIPVPLVDVAAVGGVQIHMLRRLSDIYGVPFSENLGKSVIASLAGSMIPATSGIGVASAFRFVPVLGTTIAALVMPTLSAGATYVIGKVFIQHFRSGGTLLDFNPPDYREFIKEQRRLWSTRAARTSSTASTTPPARTSSTAPTGSSTSTAASSGPTSTKP